MTAVLYLVSTPIGNLKDITIRAIETLFSVDYIACEDTRRTGQLLSALKNDDFKGKPKLISYYDEIEFKRMPEIINLLVTGKNVALVTDSGTPLISDPGFKLVKECLKRDIKVVSIPGPSSVLTSLTSSGLPTNQFLFLGYLPSKSNKRREQLYTYKRQLLLQPTIIFFEAPHRLLETLKDLKDIFGDREIVVCRELTKIHEEIWRGKITDAISHFNNPQGEFVILFRENGK